jgi:hypothetical protein
MTLGLLCIFTEQRPKAWCDSSGAVGRCKESSQRQRAGRVLRLVLATVVPAELLLRVSADKSHSLVVDLYRHDDKSHSLVVDWYRHDDKSHSLVVDLYCHDDKSHSLVVNWYRHDDKSHSLVVDLYCMTNPILLWWTYTVMMTNPILL